MESLTHGFDCPYCGARITMLLDPSAGEQRYIEDCEICCNPIEIALRFRDAVLDRFEVTSIEQ